MGTQILPDQSMYLLGIVSLVHDVGIGSSHQMTPLQEERGVSHIVSGMLRELPPGDDLLSGINRERGLDEPLPDLPGPPGVVGAGIGTGESTRIDSSDRDDLSSGIEEMEYPIEEDMEQKGPDPRHEFLQSREMGHRLQLEDLPHRCHEINQLDDITVILLYILLEQEKRQELVLGIYSFGVLAGIERKS